MSSEWKCDVSVPWGYDPTGEHAASAALRPLPALNVVDPLGVMRMRSGASGAANPCMKAALKRTPALRSTAGKRPDWVLEAPEDDVALWFHDIAHADRKTYSRSLTKARSPTGTTSQSMACPAWQLKV